MVQSALGLPYLLMELFYIGMPVVRDRRDRPVVLATALSCARSLYSTQHKTDKCVHERR